MTEVLLTLYCAPADAAAISAVLRDSVRNPVHQREEIVHGLDFSDASTAEAVAGKLKRCALDVRIDENQAETLLARIAALKRKGPVRWRLTPVLASGRLS